MPKGGGSQHAYRNCIWKGICAMFMLGESPIKARLFDDALPAAENITSSVPIAVPGPNLPASASCDKGTSRRIVFRRGKVSRFTVRGFHF